MLFVGHAKQSLWSTINLAISAVNLGDAAGDELPKEKIAEIYALAAVTVRLYFPSKFQFLTVSSGVFDAEMVCDKVLGSNS